MDSNIQRENILPSERAFAYKMKLEAMKRQGYRTDLTSDQVGQKLTSVETVAKQSVDSRTQVQRYIRLTELIPPILQMVDEGQTALIPAVELSFLKKDEQENLRITMESENAAPSFSQAKRMKKLSRMGRLDTSFHASDVTSTPRKTEGVTKKGAFSSPIRAKNWLTGPP